MPSSITSHQGQYDVLDGICQRFLADLGGPEGLHQLILELRINCTSADEAGRVDALLDQFHEMVARGAFDDYWRPADATTD